MEQLIENCRNAHHKIFQGCKWRQKRGNLKTQEQAPADANLANKTFLYLGDKRTCRQRPLIRHCIPGMALTRNYSQSDSKLFQMWERPEGKGDIRNYRFFLRKPRHKVMTEGRNYAERLPEGFLLIWTSTLIWHQQCPIERKKGTFNRRD